MWDPFASDSRVTLRVGRPFIKQREADITQPAVMICEVLYIVPESLEVSSDMWNKPFNRLPALKNKLAPAVQ